MKLERQTTKRYYEDFYLSQARSSVVKVGADYIELDATVAYPEGGGQEADAGVIELDNGCKLRFDGAKKMYGVRSGLPEFPDIQVEGVIWHLIDSRDLSLLQSVSPGTAATVRIDIERRACLSLSHTASHLLYLGVAQHRPDAVAAIIGCHIKVDGARFDFAVEERFTPEQVTLIEDAANGFVERNAAITVSAHEQVPDARRWLCEGHAIACGGTHLDRAGPVGRIEVRRKRLGAGKERLACVLMQARPEFTRYHPGACEATS